MSGIKGFTILDKSGETHHDIRRGDRKTAKKEISEELIRWDPFRAMRRWDPFDELRTMQHEMDRLFDRFLGQSF
jgi:hypothetical protein